ncbi:WecB/TagA/CpsF family glycosyltransferase [Sphingomonas sp. BIUV-7]|uniref:WecB/TagA/CpsF family glycosyltransferase n=1 Tax=Sphingomonas natans TaxID=3063330 RepID=A0ABT8YEL1_9SPHN|nr:WecB/TagA/CpsF family glycosyltransferase [Sphingomonas sp. BIUV-7]MDO6416797.1 WecB/TagA/CpsF family glycosyltransferase [Sphingomonas sp. BIUV-7]
MVRLPQLNRHLRRAYDDADLCLCDSRVLARLARLVGVRLPVAPGSDITRLLFDRLPAGDRLFLIGGTAADLAHLQGLYPALSIAQHIPPMGLLNDPAGRAAAIAAATAADARIILLAVGSPQQELIALEMKREGKVRGTALCVGASVDFITGKERRAPLPVQKAGMEWAWRLAANPRRMAKRYLVDCPAIFPLVGRWALARKRSRT